VLLLGWLSLTPFNGRENSIFWPRKRWFDEQGMKRRAAKKTIKWPRVQKLGINLRWLYVNGQLLNEETRGTDP